MILWLDDIRDPSAFRPSDDRYVWCKTNTEFIRKLDTMSAHIEGVAFDHDKSHALDSESVVAPFSCDETYEPSVRYLVLWAEKYDKRDFPVEIITSNVAGADRYKKILTAEDNTRFNIIMNLGGVRR